jgi:hypothetical protein
VLAKIDRPSRFLPHFFQFTRQAKTKGLICPSLHSLGIIWLFSSSKQAEKTTQDFANWTFVSFGGRGLGKDSSIFSELT